MLRVRRRKVWRSMTLLGLVAAAAAILVLGAGLATAKGKPPKPEEPVDTGIIYCRLDGDIYSMSPDGSGKFFLYSAPSESPEPSNLSHGGRWFLEVRPTNTGQTYPPLDPADPNGPERPRHELFAVSSGTEVRLTDDVSLEPIYWGDSECPRWAPEDTTVSWLARRWDLASGQLVPDGAGIYTLEVSFSNGQPSPVGEPCLLPCSLPWDDDTNMGPHPAVAGYDWSPDGEKIVYAESSYGWGQGLHVIDVDSGSTLLMLTSEGISPRWSPDGSKIAFHHGTGIDTIDAGGGDRVNIVSVRGRKKSNFLLGEYAFAPQWSPKGSHLVYKYENRKTSAARFMRTVDIYRVGADGTDVTNLTKDTEDYADPLGWRAD